MENDNNERKLSGRPLDLADFNLYLYGTTDPDMPHIPPEMLDKLWPAAAPRVAGLPGKVMVIGTGSPLGGSAFRELWDNAAMHKPISWSNTIGEAYKGRDNPLLHDEAGQFDTSLHFFMSAYKDIPIMELSEEGQKRADDLKNLRYNTRLDRTQPHWQFLMKDNTPIDDYLQEYHGMRPSDKYYDEIKTALYKRQNKK